MDLRAQGLGDPLSEDPDTSELFLLGYLNSALATYFLKKLVNTTATADVGYIEKLPYRRPPADLEASVVDRTKRIVALLQTDPQSDVSGLRAEIDDLIFELFEIRGSRDEVRSLYASVGRNERPSDAQAADE